LRVRFTQCKRPLQGEHGIPPAVCGFKRAGQPLQNADIIGCVRQRLLKLRDRAGSIALLLEDFGQPEHRGDVCRVERVGATERLLGRGLIPHSNQDMTQLDMQIDSVGAANEALPNNVERFSKPIPLAQEIRQMTRKVRIERVKLGRRPQFPLRRLELPGSAQQPAQHRTMGGMIGVERNSAPCSGDGILAAAEAREHEGQGTVPCGRLRRDRQAGLEALAGGGKLAGPGALQPLR
jgi:hypothetical protein